MIAPILYNTLKGTAKAPAGDFLRLRRHQNHFFNP